MPTPRIAVVIYSMYGHIGKMAEAVTRGIQSKGGKPSIYQVAETLPKDVLDSMYAPPKLDYPIITPDKLTEYDGFLLGIPTRFGTMPVQIKTFWDATVPHWRRNAFSGKYAGVFVSTAGLGGGQEITVANMMSTFVHHGINYVPLGYSRAAEQLTGLDEIHGGSPWGAGTFAASDGGRQPSKLELEIAEIQGKHFYDTLSKVRFRENVTSP